MTHLPPTPSRMSDLPRENDGPRPTTDDIGLLIDILPPRARVALATHDAESQLIEVVLDLGRMPEARFAPGDIVRLDDRPVTADDLAFVADRAGTFGRDNRAGIERTLHRISAIRNRDGDIVGLTCRVGRAVFGTLDIVGDVVRGGRGVLLLGRPGVGKTTLLREAARVLADEAARRVVVVDTSNEIAGDGDIPHPGIGRARRMQVSAPGAQHAVMIEAVENHMPEVVVIDEIGTEADAMAARTIAERGVQLIATAHGNTLDNLLKNPTLADLVGGIQTVILSDEEARRRRSQKTVPERRAEPTFPVLIEIRDRDHLAVYDHVAAAVDARLRGIAVAPEIRRRGADGATQIEPPLPLDGARDAKASNDETTPFDDPAEPASDERPWYDPTGEPQPPHRPPGPRRRRRMQRILPFAVDRRRLERAIHKLGIRARLVESLDQADLVLTIKAQRRRNPRRLRDAQRSGVPIITLKSNTAAQVESFLRRELNGDPPGNGNGTDPAARAQVEQDVEKAIDQVLDQGLPVELAPTDRTLRRTQHLLVQQAGLTSGSRGEEPFRHVVVYPR